MPARLDVLVRYTAAGSLAVAVHYALLIALVEGLAANATAASTCGFVVGVVVNYVLQYYWTFRSKGTHAHQFPRFAGIAVAMLGINAGIFWTLHARLDVHYLLAQAVAIGIVFLLNFTINSLYTFRSTPTSTDRV